MKRLGSVLKEKGKTMRLIDADALLKGKDDHQIISTHLIWNAPTVDAVQVVRCRDCEHWMAKDGQFGGFAKCALEGAWHGEEFYCANGVKRA